MQKRENHSHFSGLLYTLSRGENWQKMYLESRLHLQNFYKDTSNQELHCKCQCQRVLSLHEWHKVAFWHDENLNVYFDKILYKRLSVIGD